MSNWIKNILSTPILYGLESVNYLTGKTVMLLLNTYGQRLLKIDTDKIIKDNQTINDYNNFNGLVNGWMSTVNAGPIAKAVILFGGISVLPASTTRK